MKPSPGKSSTAATSYRLITEPDAGLAPLYELMSSAKKTLDITMYELVDTDAEQILIQAAARGVVVRVLLDQNLERSANMPAYTLLSTKGVQVAWAQKRYAATHQKTITVDSATSAILTLNLTSRYYSTSRDFALFTTSSTDIAAIEKTFEADFGAATITPPLGHDLIWSPTNAGTALVDLIHSAKKTLAIQNEEMSAPTIVSALAAAASRGVSVTITMSLNPAYTGEFTTLSAAGAKIRTYAQTAPLYIHAKVILVDAGSSDEKAFIGSENFSTASLTRNRELGITVTDPAIIASLTGTLTADFNGATPWTPQASIAALSIPVRPPS